VGPAGDGVGHPPARRRRQPPEADAVRAADDERFLRYWWFDDGNRLGLEGSLAADQGAIVATALDRMAGRMPDIVTADEPRPHSESLDVRRADALAALASAHIADDHDPDRAPRSSSTHPCRGRCGRAIVGARLPAAGRAGSCTRTTSGGGDAGAGPISTTSCSRVTSTTSSFTSTAGM
jgi:hypothetical protein